MATYPALVPVRIVHNGRKYNSFVTLFYSMDNYNTDYKKVKIKHIQQYKAKG